VSVTVETAARTAPAAVIIAIDGPSGTGKSSTSKAVAAQLGLSYLDTGAQYRAITWWMIGNGVDVDDPAAVANAADKPALVSGTDPAAPTITVDGVDVSGPIRTQEVTAAVSAVSAVPEVRARLVALQRAAVRAARDGIVVEGRDIGTTVLPDAPVKIFLTASAEARAGRRISQRGIPVQPDGLDAEAAALAARDHADSTRAVAPLKPAEDAVHLDTTTMDFSEQVRFIVELARPIFARR
jgi:CMP/dCMP kinase